MTQVRATAPMRYRFGPFEMDTGSLRLRGEQGMLSIKPQVFDLIAYLVAHRDRIVSRDELFGRLWPNAEVFDGALSQAVYEARQALAHSSSARHSSGAQHSQVKRRWIRTVRGRGFQFVGPVLELPSLETPANFIGREAELARLQAALEQARTGRGQVRLLRGELGAGKTSCVREFMRAACLRGAAGSDLDVVEARCGTQQNALSYGPWIEIFESLAQRQSGFRRDEASDSPDSRVRALRRRLHAPPPQTSEAEFRLHIDAARCLREMAEQALLVVAIDDLHAADEASLRLLSFVASEIGRSRVLLIGMYRGSDVTTDHPLCSALMKLRSVCHYENLPIQGWSAREVGLWLAAQSRTDRGARIDHHGWADHHAWTDLHTWTGGNPLFIQQMLAGPATKKALPPQTKICVPAAAQRWLQSRLEKITADDRTLLETAAVIGPAFDIHLLQRATKLPRLNVASALEQLCARHIVRRCPVQRKFCGPGTYEFAHPFFRPALIRELEHHRLAHLRSTVEQVVEAERRRDPTYLRQGCSR